MKLTRGNVRSFYNKLSTELLMARLKMFDTMPNMTAADYLKKQVIETILYEREGKSCI